MRRKVAGTYQAAIAQRFLSAKRQD